MKRILLAILYLIFAVSAQGQSVVCGDSVRMRMAVQLQAFPQEKIYMHTDRQNYMRGDTLWFRGHLVDASSHRLVAASKYLYVELHGSEKEGTETPIRVRIREKEGVYAGYIALPMTIPSGEYTLCAYTHFMRNVGPEYFFRKNIRVGTLTAEPRQIQNRQQGVYDVAFFAEGGYLAAGESCCVGFKALRSDGMSAAVSGVVRDKAGREVAAFSSQHAGMGKFFFTPEAGNSYTAVCTDDSNFGRSFRLPAPREDVCVLKVFPSSNRFTVEIAAPGEYDTSDLSLMIHCRGEMCYYNKWDGRYKTFENNDFPDGVLQLLLLDKVGNVLSERLVFCFDAHAQSSLTVGADKPDYRRREKVTLTARLSDGGGKPLAGDFSVAVTDNRMVDDYRPSTICTSLLLESELRGYIEDPAYYFDAQYRDRLAEVDALMLTQGWRRYDVSEVVRGNYTIPVEPLEIGQEITGRIRKTGILRKRNFNNYKVEMLAPAFGVMAQTRVDSAGGFVLNGFDLPDGGRCVVRASGADEQEDVELLIDAERYPGVPRPLPVPNRDTLRSRYDRHLVSFVDSLKNILIEEVIVSCAVKKPPKTAQEALAVNSIDDKEIEREHYGSLEQALQSKHGVSVRQGYISVFQRPAVFIIDGVIWEQLELMEGFADKIPAHLPMDFIKRIDIIPPVNSTLYGAKVSGCGVIYITTKTGEELLAGKHSDLDRLNIKTISLPGYQLPAEYYAPVYDTPKRRNAPEPDLRMTLYWNPSLRFEEGEAVIEFYTGDHGTDYTIHFDGVADCLKGSVTTKTIHL